MKANKIQQILSEVQVISDHVQEQLAAHANLIDEVHESNQLSAANLVSYLALRSFDLRDLQHKLGYLGMSRLARAEAHTEASLKTTIFFLKTLLGLPVTEPQRFNLSIKKSEKKLARNTKKLLGKGHRSRRLRIMVTMPNQSATHPTMVLNMAKEGMDVARINCAHDTPDDWKRMIESIKKAGKKLNKPITIAMDIGGPKIRTGQIQKPLKLKMGDKLYLTKDSDQTESDLPAIACTCPEVLDHLQPDNPVYFDDGKIKAEVIEISSERALLKVTRTKDGGSKLKADKGINLPETPLFLHGLTEVDRKNLAFIGEHADVLNFSFANTVEDVKELHEELKSLGVFEKLGIVYKIETQQAFDNLPEILMEAMKGKVLGVMIARGDLAIEVGWKKLGYVQKEILAICNACHVPVIWATQVLENLAKKGLPSRSEVTDSVNAIKAECIMLNKGPHITDAIKLLDQIITQTEPYQDKNAPLLPKLEKRIVQPV